MTHVRNMTLALVASSAVAVLAPTAGAQTISTLALEGDDVPAVGLVVEIDNLAINDAGFWLVEVETDNPNPDIANAILSASGVDQQEGDPLSAPPGATIRFFDEISINGNGNVARDYTIDVGGSGTWGLYYDAALVYAGGDPIGAAGYAPGSTYGSISDVKLNDNDLMLVRGWGDDLGWAGTSDWYAMLVQVDSSGALLSETLIAKEGDVLPGQANFINTIRSSPHAGAINDSGTAIFAADLDGSTSDAVVYMYSSGVLTKLAQEDDPSPVVGRTWGDLLAPEIDLNDAGDWTLKDELDGSVDRWIITKNGAKFRQAGDTLPAISPFSFDYFGNGPAALTDAGDVLWYGEWDDPDPSIDTGLFLNDTLLVQEGVTTVGGVTIDEIEGQSDAYAISPNGEFIVFEATLVNGLEGAFLLQFLQPTTAYCTAKVNSQGCTPAISWTGTPSATAGSGFDIDGAMVLNNKVGIFFYSKAGRATIPFQGGTLCAQPPLQRTPLRNSGGNPPPDDCSGVFTIDFNAWIATGNDAALVPGQTVNGQYWSRDPTASFTTNLTDAIEFDVAP